MRTRSVLAIIALASLLAAASALGGDGAKAGGWKPIEDLSDPQVKEVAKFAVSEYNKQSKAALRLKSIVKGETQVVAGINYRLDLAVANGSATERYEAIVWDKPWLHYRNLTSFKPIS